MNSAQRRKARRAKERIEAKAQPAIDLTLQQAVAAIQQRVAVLALPAPKPIISVSDWEAFTPVKIGPLPFAGMAYRSSNGYVYDRRPAYQVVAA